MNTKQKLASFFLSFLVLGLYPTLSSALTFPLSPNENVVGAIQEAFSLSGETLSDVGRRFDIGYYEMLEANPNVSPDSELSSGTRLVIPSRYVLPPTPREGIVINLAELRLYYYPAGTNTVVTDPVGIGRIGWYTPLGVTRVVSKVKDPTWRPTAHVRAEAQRLGYLLPDVWPAGADNPLGQYALYLGWPTFLIHGTPPPFGVGKRSSAGCIRMYPEDIDAMYHSVRVGIKVTVVNSPIKVGWQGNKFYLEAHRPLEEKGKFVTDDTIHMVDRIHDATKNRRVVIRWKEAQEAVKRQSGIPTVIGERGQKISMNQD
jgi:L,D-transpeptidase ErfK/SrfK